MLARPVHPRLPVEWAPVGMRHRNDKNLMFEDLVDHTEREPPQ